MNDERNEPGKTPEAIDAEELLLSAYALGELDSEEAKKVEERLGKDPAARATVDEIRATVELLGAMPASEDTLDAPRRAQLIEAAAGQMASAAGPARASRSGGALRFWGGALAAAVVLGAVLPFLWTPPAEERSRLRESDESAPRLGERDLNGNDDPLDPAGSDAVLVARGEAAGAAAGGATPLEELARGVAPRSSEDAAAAKAPGTADKTRPAPDSLESSTSPELAGVQLGELELDTEILNKSLEEDRRSAGGRERLLVEWQERGVPLLRTSQSGENGAAPVDRAEVAVELARNQTLDHFDAPQRTYSAPKAPGEELPEGPSVPTRGRSEPAATPDTTADRLELESVSAASDANGRRRASSSTTFRDGVGGSAEGDGASVATAPEGEARQNVVGEALWPSSSTADAKSEEKLRGAGIDSRAAARGGRAEATPGAAPQPDGRTRTARRFTEPSIELASPPARPESAAPAPQPAAGGAAAATPVAPPAGGEPAPVDTGVAIDGARGEAAGEPGQAEEAGQAGLAKDDGPAAAGRDAESAKTELAAEARAKLLVDEFLTRLDRRAGETPEMMLFRYYGTNSFVETHQDPVKTFAVDVDTSSYTLFRSYLYKQRQLPPREAIRTEEFLNYFDGGYAPPTAQSGRAFAVHTEVAPSPFAHEPDYKLLRIGIKGREVARAERRACSLVFVVDTSGSMRRENRIELVKDALRVLVSELDEGDSIGIVAFDREARTILEPLPASEAERILDGIALLEPRQNTNVDAGLTLGYEMASRHLLAGGNNRVLLLSDGVANTGNTDPNVMLERVRTHRERGIYLTCVGVGMGNHNDALLQELADRGNGQCVYVDRKEEAERVFVENLTGTLEPIARDAKIQVELDPAKVLRYRLLGYENRDLADADFRNNAVDAGEVGAGHEVTALFELKLRPESSGDFAQVHVRYLTVDDGEAVEFDTAVGDASVHGSFADASAHFRLAACVAETAEILRESYWARGSTLDDVLARLEPLTGTFADDADVLELVALVRSAAPLWRQRQGEVDELARTVDALKDASYRRALAEERGDADADTRHLRDLQRQTDALRDRLEKLLR